MLTHEHVSDWLDAYIQAWESYDPQAIGDLFSADAVYSYHPYDEPARGREAIVKSCLDDRDELGTYSAQYEPVLVEGNRAITHGRSKYFGADHTTVEREFDNIFLITFDDDGRCSEFAEWYMAPRGQR